MDFLLAATDAKQKYIAYMKDWQIYDQPFIEKAFQYNQSELLVSFDQLVSQLMFKESHTLTYVDKIAVIPIDDRYIVQPIYVKTMLEDLHLLVERIHIAFQQLPLDNFKNGVAVYLFYQQLTQQLFSKKEALALINQTTQYLLKTRTKTLALKEIHLLYIVFLFTQRQQQTNHYIKAFLKRWSKGKWALTEKEEVLLTYLRMHMAAWKQRWQRVLRLGESLLVDDKLANHVVELTVDYGKFLPSYNSDASQLVKSFKTHFLQYTWYLLIEALYNLGKYSQMIDLLKSEPHASSDAFVDCLNSNEPEHYIYLEANIQQSIANYIEGHSRNVKQALMKWHQLREMGDAELEEMIKPLSAHLCRIMKALYYTGQQSLYEIMRVNYDRYFFVEAHGSLFNKEMNDSLPKERAAYL